MSKILFVGGCLDGQWLEIPDDLNFHEALALGPLQPRRDAQSGWACEQKTGVVHAYARTPFRDKEGCFDLFLLNGNRLPMRALMNGYHPGEAVSGNVQTGSGALPYIGISLDMVKRNEILGSGIGGKATIVFQHAA